MAVFRNGKLLDIPWDEKFEGFLIQVAESTYKYEGEELIHQLHMEVIETRRILIRFYKRLRLMFGVVIALLIVIAMASFQ